MRCTQAKAGTANLTKHSDPAIMAMANMQSAPTTEGGLSALGLEYQDDVEDMNFDD